MSASAKSFDANVTGVGAGAGSGIGRATAVALAESGARVLGVGRRKDALEQTVRTHSDIEILPLDICAEGAEDTVVATAVAR